MNPKHPENEAQQIFEWFIHNILVLWQRDRCAVWSVFSLLHLLWSESRSADTVTIWEEFERELWCYYLCTFFPFDCISSSIFPVFYTLVSLVSLFSLSVVTHSSFNSFSPEENLMAQILLSCGSWDLMLFFIEVSTLSQMFLLKFA